MVGNGDVSEAEVVAMTLALFRQATTLAARLAEVAGLAPTDATALRALDLLGSGQRPVGALGQELGLSSAATTGVIDRLERAGLAQRQGDPADRRRVLVALTPQARTFGAEHLRPILERTTKAASALNPAQRATVGTFLAHVLGRPADATGTGE
jgi:DNA-binding MarR family transcriptional regulator